jgi:hypothetical protein
MLDQVEDVLFGKQLVFLVGAPRSGTTWLQLLLSRSRWVVTSQETDLFSIYLRPIVGEWNRCRATGTPVILSEVLSNEDFRTLLRSASAFVFAKIARAKPSATVVLEKTPEHVNHCREILELWPDAHFIHIIRDPRSVVASLRHASKTWGPSWGSSKISTIAENWAHDVSNGLKIRSTTNRYQQITYQDLISDGPGALLRLLTGLGVLVSLGECQQYFEECKIDKLKVGQLSDAPFNISNSGKYRFRVGSTDGWRKELSRWEVAVVERVVGPLMLELGFTPETRGMTMRTLMMLDHVARRYRTSVKRRLQSWAEKL